MPCRYCSQSPCVVKDYNDFLRQVYDTLPSGLSAAMKRHHLYSAYVCAAHGPLGRFNRIEIKLCIVKFIRTLSPSPNGSYVASNLLSIS